MVGDHRNGSRWRFLVQLAGIGLFLACASLVNASQRGVIDDPDGYVNVRSQGRSDAPIVTKVKQAVPFTFEWKPGDEWCRVKLGDGKQGWMHHSRVRLYFTAKDLPKKDAPGEPPSEVDEAARSRGLNYVKVTAAAARGDRKSLQDFFKLGLAFDGAAAESHTGVPTAVYHLLGDEAFAAFLKSESIESRTEVRSSIVGDAQLMPNSIEYLRGHFPRSAELLFPQEVTGWVSPDGRYAIRKTFDGSFMEGTKVSRAELLEVSSQRTIANLTGSDIGVGFAREGSVLWSPDSRRFAYLSCDLTVTEGSPFAKPPPRPQRKQTVIYQSAGDTFVEVPLGPSATAPHRDDARLKGAVLGHEFTEPIEWQKDDVLVLQRHEYYQKLEPTLIGKVKFDEVKYFDRLYRIVAKVRADGKAEVSCEERKDRE